MEGRKKRAREEVEQALRGPCAAGFAKGAAGEPPRALLSTKCRSLRLLDMQEKLRGQLEKDQREEVIHILNLIFEVNTFAVTFSEFRVTSWW